MSKIIKLYENAGIKPEYRYDCNLADAELTEVFPLHRCSKSEIKDYCTNKQDYQYCKVYKVNKIYPPFTAEKQLKILCLIVNSKHSVTFHDQIFGGDKLTPEKIQENLAWAINRIWQDLTEEEKQQVKGILE